jgi:hypothetical protein
MRPSPPISIRARRHDVKLAEATLREERDEKAAFMEAEGRSLADVMGAYFDGADSEARAVRRALADALPQALERKLEGIRRNLPTPEPRTLAATARVGYMGEGVHS